MGKVKKREAKEKKRSRSESTKARNNEAETQQDDSSAPEAINASLDTNIVSAASSCTSGWSWGAAFQAAASIRPNDNDLDDDFLRRTASQNEGGGLAALSQFASQQSQHVVPTATVSSNIPPEETEKDDTKSVKSKKERKREKKDRKRSSDASKLTDHVVQDDVVEEQKPSKKKKKRKRQDLDENNDQDDDQVNQNENDSSSSLEGRMVKRSCNRSGEEEDVMVLIDWAKKVVYSAFDRAPNGDRLVLGNVVNGKVQLDEVLQVDDESENMIKEFPYPTDPDDHCETPLDAYQDIAPFLDKLCQLLGKQKSELSIYDPYYCNGSVVRHLQSLGYTQVYNKKEDAYHVWSSASADDYPPCDVLLTNPPYSGDHIEKLMQHVTSSSGGSKPWCLLMPTWVHKKDYYIRAIQSQSPFYVVPRKKRYVYVPPKDFRERKASDVHKKSSPFISMWYICGGTSQRTNQLMEHYYTLEKAGSGPQCDLARSRSALRDLRRKGKVKK